MILIHFFTQKFTFGLYEIAIKLKIKQIIRKFKNSIPLPEMSRSYYPRAPPNG